MRRTTQCTRRAAQESGEFAGAFWLCAQCARALAPLDALLVAPELTATVSALYEETLARLESALQTVCADFQPGPYAKARPLLLALCHPLHASPFPHAACCAASLAPARLFVAPLLHAAAMLSASLRL